MQSKVCFTFSTFSPPILEYSMSSKTLAITAVRYVLFPLSLNINEGRQCCKKKKKKKKIPMGWQMATREWGTASIYHLLWAIFKLLSLPLQSLSNLKNVQHLSQGLTDFYFTKLHSGYCQNRKGEEVQGAFSCVKFPLPAQPQLGSEVLGRKAPG